VLCCAAVAHSACGNGLGIAWLCGDEKGRCKIVCHLRPDLLPRPQGLCPVLFLCFEGFKTLEEGKLR
jgi:hypothetical protein